MPQLLRLAALLFAASAAGAAVPMNVVAGSTVVQDLAQRIGGERVAVSGLLPPGIDAHHYQPVPEDIRRLATADLVVLNGLGFEGWFDALCREAGFHGTVVVASAGIVPLRLADADHPGGMADDPHAFNSVLLGVRYAENLRDALIAADPAGADGIRARAAGVVAELRRLDAWARREVARIPPERRILVTDHDALQYFARDYGFTLRAVNTALADSEPSARQAARLVDFVRAQGVRGIFLERGRRAPVVEQIAREAGVRLAGDLCLDGLGPAGSPTGTYAGMFEANVKAIVAALE
jgi:zinc/manganese transport system substrate-binding protein